LATKTPETIYITESDYGRLEGLLAVAPRSANTKMLEEELARATVVAPEKVPPDVVTMNSKIRFRDEGTGEESEVMLVYPHSADISHGKVSVLAPVGSALLGLSVGDTIEWPTPSGKTRRLQIVSVLFQPEAAGRFD